MQSQEIIENFDLGTVHCDKAIQSLRNMKIPEKDARLSFYYKIRTLYNMFRISYTFYEKYLLTQKFWEENYPDHILSNKNMKKLYDEYDMFIRSNFITEMYSAFESSLRVIIKNIEPDYYEKNKTRFSKMTRKILTDFKLPQEIPLLKHFSILRNSMHSNGIFDPPNAKNEIIEYKGKKFVYEVGKLIKYAGWTDLLSISKLIHYLFFDIINLTLAQKILFIKEPFSDYWDTLDDPLPNS